MNYPKAYVDKLRRMYNYRHDGNSLVLDDKQGEVDIDLGLDIPMVILMSEIDEDAEVTDDVHE